MIKWTTADSEGAKEYGILYLCRHGERLGLPYKWNTVLSALACSLDQNGFLIGLDDSGRIAGALAFTYGTGDDDYKDRTRIEVHLLYIEERLQNGRNLLEAMRALARQMLSSPNGIREITFYAAPSAGNRRLFGKFATLASTSEHPCGLLDFYTILPADLLEYAARRTS